MQLHAQPSTFWLGCLFWSAKRFVLGKLSPQRRRRAIARVGEGVFHDQVVFAWKFHALLAPHRNCLSILARQRSNFLIAAECGDNVVEGPERLERRDHALCRFLKTLAQSKMQKENLPCDAVHADQRRPYMGKFFSVRP